MTDDVRSVLVVDDCRSIVEALARVFERAGYRVFTGENGAEAIAIARCHALDAAVVDYRMPGPDGIHVLSELLERQPRSVRVLTSGEFDIELAFEAVNRGRVCRVVRKPFDPAKIVKTVDTALLERARLERSSVAAAERTRRAERELLLECFEGGALQLAVQPIVTAADCRVAAVEALLRSSHPAFPGPAQVLDAAERHDLLPRLGDRVAHLAAEWCRQLPPSIRVFVNLHPDDLADPDALRARIEPLRPHAGRVVTEITERAELPAEELRCRSLAVLSEAGFAVAVDDLGSGRNGLATLASLHPEYVKIDMRIVRGIDANPRKQHLMHLLCDYARGSNATVVAEGVETEAEATTVSACGASLLQGYLFGRPRLPSANPAPRPAVS